MNGTSTNSSTNSTLDTNSTSTSSNNSTEKVEIKLDNDTIPETKESSGEKKESDEL